MVNDKPRVKRHPWFEYHNSTYYISRNYTHEQLIKAPTIESQKVEARAKAQKAADLARWQNEKIGRCKEYKQLLQICHKDNVFWKSMLIQLACGNLLGNIEQGDFEQVFDEPAPGIDIPFL